MPLISQENVVAVVAVIAIDAELADNFEAVLAPPQTPRYQPRRTMEEIVV